MCVHKKNGAPWTSEKRRCTKVHGGQIALFADLAADGDSFPAEILSALPGITGG